MDAVKICIPVINPDVRKLCQKPYPNHPNGCPKFGKRKCPPYAPLISDVIDLSQTVYCIYNCFDFKAHVDRMKLRDWCKTDRQAECCLYWQGTARKQLKDKIKTFFSIYKGYHIVSCPEACGVDVTATMKQIGINLEWPPINYTYQVVLAGLPLKGGCNE